MRVLRSHSGVPPDLKGCAIAIGNFDGVHRGHQAVLGEARTIAAGLGAGTGALLFEPHPRLFFSPDTPLFTLTPLTEKLALLGALGLDLAAVLPFDATMAALSAEDFVERVLVGGFGIRHAVIGYDFHFGRGRLGTPDRMRELGEHYGFGVTVAGAAQDGGVPFSSSEVRRLLRAGHVRAAAEVLGHWWRVTGRVVGGAKRGTGMGYPTANIHLAPGQQLGHGIFAVWAHVDGARHPAAAYNGTRPTFDNGAPVLEVFLLDFDGDLYGREITVEFIDLVREDRTFDSVESLIQQMDSDCVAARKRLHQVALDDPMVRFPIGAWRRAEPSRA